MTKFYTRKRIAATLVAILFVFSISAIVYSYASGRAGCTLLTHTTGCNCHSTSSTAAVVVTLAGPDTVLASSTTNYTFSVSRSSGTFSTGGIDVAVSSGTLGIGTSTGIKILSGEVVQSAKFTSATTKTFTYTAPSTAGTITMACTGAAGSNPPAWNNSPNKTIVVRTASGVENNKTPVSFSLSQNYPNPFNPVTKINYSVAKAGNVKITVYDILGNEIQTIVNHKHENGNYSADFDGSKLSSGTYIYKIETGDFSEVKKMTLIK
jgi:hypothetical protein